MKLRPQKKTEKKKLIDKLTDVVFVGPEDVDQSATLLSIKWLVLVLFLWKYGKYGKML